MLKLKVLAGILILSVISFTGCKASYPKETLDQSISDMIYKETKESSKVDIVGKTIYVDMELANLSSTDQKLVTEAIGKMQNAVFAVTRVALSSDADAQFLVVTSYDANYALAIRSVQNIDDIKAYMYMRISRDDYQERSVFEIEGAPFAEQIIKEHIDITETDYIGRVIIAQVTTSAKSNPLLGSIFSTLKLRYIVSDAGTMYIALYGTIDDKMKNLLEGALKEEAIKQLSKYKKTDITNLKIINPSRVLLLDISLNSASMPL